MRALAWAAVMVASVALGDVPAPRAPACGSDSDCTLTTFSGCCPSCCPRTSAMPVSALRAEQSRCARSKMECPMKDCAPCRAEPEPPTAARCRQGQCVAEPSGLSPVPGPTIADLASGACTLDSECVITSFGGCCGTCCPTPHAASRQQLERESARCRVIDCAGPRCEGQTCKLTLPESAFRAVCRAGTCAAERRSTPPLGTECNSPADCTVRYAGPGPDAACRRSPCGCCPGGEPMAVPARAAAVPLTKSPSGLREPGAAPPFGLSEGKGNGPAGPACSPCPAPRAASATCVSGRCVLAPDGPHILE